MVKSIKAQTKPVLLYLSVKQIEMISKLAEARTTTFVGAVRQIVDDYFKSCSAK